jgi:hypothetical protein
MKISRTRQSIGYGTFWTNLNLIAPWRQNSRMILGQKNRPFDDLARPPQALLRVAPFDDVRQGDGGPLSAT